MSCVKKSALSCLRINSKSTNQTSCHNRQFSFSIFGPWRSTTEKDPIISTNQSTPPLSPSNSLNFSTDSNSDKKKNQRWFNIGILKENGRAFEANTSLISHKKAAIFPHVQCFTLDGETKLFPDQACAQHVPLSTNNSSSSSNKSSLANSINITTALNSQNQVKLVSLSFKHYGSTLLKSWNEPFINHYNDRSKSNNNNNNNNNNNPNRPPPLKPLALEINFIEYSFLSIAKGMFINDMKAKLPVERHPYISFAFGGVREFADKLELPNVFTGYVFLVDSKNRVRWRGCGQAKPHEIQTLIKLTDELCQEIEVK